jgi:hypothetical protein
VKKIVIYLLALSVSGKSFSQDVIAWDSAIKLTWADFAGKADLGSPYNAATISGILYKIYPRSDGYSDSIIAVFYTSESWVKDRTESALIHEQGHFDITEIFARKLRKRLQEFVPRRGDLNHQLNLLYDEMERERDAMENLYDQETGHSADPVRQARWNVRIRNELRALEEFAN